jgi:hypothetical protein
MLKTNFFMYFYLLNTANKIDIYLLTNCFKSKIKLKWVLKKKVKLNFL